MMANIEIQGCASPEKIFSLGIVVGLICLSMLSHIVYSLRIHIAFVVIPGEKYAEILV